jgi:outer membrane protein OmpA-like peptidoglycan-associated protein
MKASRGTLATLACALLIAGCAGTPEHSDELAAAQTAVDQAKTDQRVVDYAAAQLVQAEKDLAKAEDTYADHGSEVMVEHYAYLATREAQTASAIGETGALKKEIEQASAERDRVRLEARDREVDQAKSKAAVAENKADLLQERLAELEAKQTERGLVVTLQDVLFDVDRAELKPGAYRTVDNLAAFMRDYPDRRVRIEGFTDSTGSDSYNQQLSESRAFAVRNALEQAGIDSSRIEVRGYGETNPVASNDTSAGRQLNRRVEVLISDEQGSIASR